MIKRFIKWWESKLQISLGFLVFTHIAQIPHFLWGGDAIAQTGYVYGVHIMYDFILYGIDLIEIPAIVIALLSFASTFKRKVKKIVHKKQ